ncbi:hypothetical protein D3C76_1670990 [compost metagenome]
MAMSARWNMGATRSMLSSGRKNGSPARAIWLLQKLRWLSITPLGKPVVPPV